MNRISNNAAWKNMLNSQDAGAPAFLEYIKAEGFIPYAGNDATCGIENEFQTAVSGKSSVTSSTILVYVYEDKI